MSEDESADFEEPVDQEGVGIKDPYSHLVPILSGHNPEEAGIVVGEGVRALRVRNTHRNLWQLNVEGIETVTFDADAFATTVDLGQYIAGLIRDLEELVDGGDERDDVEEDPRQIDGENSTNPAFQ